MSIDGALLIAILAAFLAALVRGFSGFGAALIFMPVASAILGPKLAAPVFLTTDFILTVPMFLRALSLCRWPTVLPVALAALVTAPIGAYVLSHGDPLALRWGITALVVALLALTMSGWRYGGEPRAATSVGVGGVAGFLGGFGQISGPPVIALWVSGPHPPPVVRANLIVFFEVITASSFAAYVWHGLYTWEVGRLVLLFVPVYAAALFIGAALFRRAGGAYRSLVYALIALAAITSMPVFDGVLR